MNLPALFTSLQTANRHIQELQDTIHHWQIKYQQRYHRHFQLEQQQLWCNTCRSRFDLEEDIELCPNCTRRLQKLDNLNSLAISRYPQVTTTSRILDNMATNGTTFEEKMNSIIDNDHISFEQKMKLIGQTFKQEMEHISQDFQKQLHQSMQQELQYLHSSLQDIWKPK